MSAAAVGILRCMKMMAGLMSTSAMAAPVPHAVLLLKLPMTSVLTREMRYDIAVVSSGRGWGLARHPEVHFFSRMHHFLRVRGRFHT